MQKGAISAAENHVPRVSQIFLFERTPMFTGALECAVQGQLCFLLENLAWFPLFPMELTAEIYTTKPPLFEALRTFFTQLHSEKVAPNFRSPFMAVSPSFPATPGIFGNSFCFPSAAGGSSPLGGQSLSPPSLPPLHSIPESIIHYEE